MTVIRPEVVSDIPARDALLDAAFGPLRFRKSSQRLRDGRLPAEGLSLIACEGEALLGTVRLWHVDASGRPALLLGPLAVDAACRAQGLGSALMEDALARAAAAGHGAVLLVGDAAYYRRFGFDAAPTAHLRMPGPYEPARFLARELKAGFLSGARGCLRPTGALDIVTTAPLAA